MHRLEIFTRRGACAALALLLLGGCLSEFFDPTRQEGLQIVFAPRDTAVYVGGALQARARMRNHYGDVYPSDHIVYAGSGDVLSVSESGRIAGKAYGRSRIVARRSDLFDTGWVSVVPEGAIAMSFVDDGPSALDLVELDGSAFRRLALVGQRRGGAAGWLPSADGLIYHALSPESGQTILYRSDLAGNATPLLPPLESGATEERYARVSRDGIWVYFRLAGRVNGGEIWRIHPDGAGFERVTCATCLGAVGQDTHPDPSPDGTRLLFTSDRFPGGGFEIGVRNLASGAEQSFAVQGLLPRWSPTGDRIAYFGGEQAGGPGAIYVMSPDGLGRGQVSPVGRDYIPEALDWSPDGQ
jgi:hypothetical protein